MLMGVCCPCMVAWPDPLQRINDEAQQIYIWLRWRPERRRTHAQIYTSTRLCGGPGTSLSSVLRAGIDSGEVIERPTSLSGG